MSNNLTKEQEKRLREIDARITDLRAHQHMWAKAGGVGGGMALRAVAELDELELEKEDILNGTNNAQIARIERELAQYRYLKKQAGFLEKFKYAKAIREKKEELEKIKVK